MWAFKRHSIARSLFGANGIRLITEEAIANRFINARNPPDMKKRITWNINRIWSYWSVSKDAPAIATGKHVVTKKIVVFLFINQFSYHWKEYCRLFNAKALETYAIGHSFWIGAFCPYNHCLIRLACSEGCYLLHAGEKACRSILPGIHEGQV